MVNISASNVSNEFSSCTKENVTKHTPSEKGLIMPIVINSIACPFIVLLNVLVIMAVKRKPRLQTKTNVLLACLAATDVLTGLTVQPSFILWKMFQFLGKTSYADSFRLVHNCFIRAVSVCSCLHLMLVTCERLIAITFTEHYHYIVIKRNIKVAVISFWMFTICLEASRQILKRTFSLSFFNLLVAIVLISCILFILISYGILYRETLRHRKKIKTQQLPQEEVERFVKESKALKTTVLVVGSLLLCFLPMAFATFIITPGRCYNIGLYKIIYAPPYIRTSAMFNSFLNPLIYCWRQKEMRRFVLRLLPAFIAPTQN